MQAHPIRVRIITFFQRISPGILLGVMQLILLFLGFTHSNTTGIIIIVWLVLYFVIPGLAALRNARRREPDVSGLGTGLVTGLTCATFIILVVIILSIIAANTPQPTPPGRFAFVAVASAIGYLIEMTFIVNLVGIMLALIGGVLGGFIGRRRIAEPGGYD